MSILEVIATAEAENNGELYATSLRSHDHILITDEPQEYGGKNKGPSPGDLLCMALASCKAITMRMYANRKGWAVENIKVKAYLVKGSSVASGNNTFYCEISISGTVDEAQRNRLVEIAKACPVHKLFVKQSDVETILK